MTATTQIIFLAASLSALLGCGDDDAPAVCTAGMSVACVGSGGCAGGQACNSEGTGFDACVCGGFDAGRADSGASDTGTNDTGVLDTSIGDVGMDAGARDVATIDVGTDSGMMDAGPSDAGFDVGPPPSFNCDPFTHVPCDGDTPRCTLVSVDDGVLFDCFAVGIIPVGESCEVTLGAPDDCEAGSICSERCYEVCDGNAVGTECSMGGACARTDLVNDEYSVGVCF